MTAVKGLCCRRPSPGRSRRAERGPRTFIAVSTFAPEQRPAHHQACLPYRTLSLSLCSADGKEQLSLTR
ncbi:hypothetical protein GN956_G16123 [Arapaima gigas]